MAKLYDEELIAIIKSSYENGASISKLSKNHNVPTGTIKTWSSKWGWTKKKPNQTTKPQTTNKKVVEKDTKIKSDILKGKSREEVMKENGISNTTYFRKKNSIREMVVERNKKILEEASDELIPYKKDRLLKTKEIKMKLLDEIDEKILKGCDDETLKSLNNRLVLITKAEKELYKELRIKVTYEESQFEKELTEEDLAKERLEIEKLKQNITQEKEQVVILNDMEVDDE